MRFKDLNKINQEEFNKMPQLDRIEFRQKRDFLERNKFESEAMVFLSEIFKVMLFLYLVILTSYIAFPTYFKSLFITYIYSFMPLILKVGITMFFILIILKLFFKILENKQENKIMEQYFIKESIKFKVKKK